MSVWSGNIDYDELREARELLSVIEPVCIRRTSLRRKNGDHRFVGGWHLIRLSSQLTTEEANLVLLHELAHGRQVEYLGCGMFVRSYGLEQRWKGYRRNKFEADARLIAELYHRQFRIAV